MYSWVRLYPKLLAWACPSFSYSSCTWKVGKGKRGTGRVVSAKDVGVPLSYTIESSFFGFRGPDGTVTQNRPRVEMQWSGASLALGVLLMHKLGPEVERETRRRAMYFAGNGTPRAPSRQVETPDKSEASGDTCDEAAAANWLLGPVGRDFD